MSIRRKNNVIKFKTGRTILGSNDENRVVIIAVIVAAIIGVILAFMPNAYKISINGEFIGAIKDKKVIEGAKETVISQLKEQYGTDVKFQDDLEIKRYKAKKRDYIDQTYLISCMRNKMDILVGLKEIYVEGVSIGIVSSEKDVEELKENLKKKYYGDCEGKAEFGKKVEVKDVFSKEENIISMEKLVQKCSQTTPKSITYTVEAGDTLSGIASKYNTTMDSIISANPGFSMNTVLKLGQVIKANINEPLLPVNIIKEEKDSNEGNSNGENKETDVESR